MIGWALGQPDCRWLARLSVIALLLTIIPMPNSGCALLAAGVAGGVAAAEIQEDDGDFDPLENMEVGREVDDAVDGAIE
jgi:hypothetical protein